MTKSSPGKKGSARAQRHQTCSICRTLPDRAEASWHAGEPMGGHMPRAESRLEVVGAPFFDDRESYSHSCLKQCPKCGTYYDWDFSYEFLVAGSEDEIVLTRLSDEEGQRRAEAVFEAIRADAEKFRAEAPPHLDTLLGSRDGKGVYGAAYFLDSGRMRGHDIAFAIPALTSAFIRFAGNEALDSIVGLVSLVLSSIAQDSPQAAGQIRNILQAADVDPSISRIRLVIASCERALRSGPGG
ncbi:MAG: hypothetical protein ACE5H9_05905 [Anaerolineae bacterium]